MRRQRLPAVGADDGGVRRTGRCVRKRPLVLHSKSDSNAPQKQTDTLKGG